MHQNYKFYALNCVAECGCGLFNSYSACAACDRHWEEHETFFETEHERKEKGLPFGMHYSFVTKECCTLRQLNLR